MCGIAGVIGGRVDGPALVSRMLDAMQHRGPDGEGLWTQPDGAGLTLGHRRLAILDLSPAGAQPMHHAETGCVLTFNGEIYNFVEVREELARLGARFSSGSDTEVILAAYARWGSDCLAKFNGMFAFALYDPRRRVLFCARDRYGEKPFLYHAAPGLFAFASEYKALLLHPDIPLDIDEGRLLRAAHDASTGLDADRETVFRGVMQLLPGEALEVSLASGAVRTWRYWQVRPSPSREVADEREVFEEFRRLLVDSVRLRMRSDVPVGSCLSGGLDSSAIVCIVRQLIGDDRPYHTFTGHFPGSQADEWPYARQVVEATGATSHRVEPSVDRFMAQLPAFAWYNELPVGSSSQFAQWSVFQLARENGVTVLLDGQGADEALGGYEQYFGAYVSALRERGDEARLAHELPRIRERYPLALVPPSRALRDRLPFRARHWLSNRFGIGTSLLYGLRPDLARLVQSETAPRRKAGFDPLASALEQDCFGRYLTTLLRYGDRNSMAHSREVRLPFCDHRIAEFVLQLPPQLVMGDVQTKRLLRESMRGILPEPIRARWNKQGFRPPQETWFESPAFLALARDTLSSPRFVGNPAWETGWWRNAMDRIAAGQTRLGWIVWAPLSIEWWRRHFVDELVARRATVAAELALRAAA